MTPAPEHHRAAQERDVGAGGGVVPGPFAAAARERLLDGLAVRPVSARVSGDAAGRETPGVQAAHRAKIWLLVTLEAWLGGVARPFALSRQMREPGRPLIATAIGRHAKQYQERRYVKR